MRTEGARYGGGAATCRRAPHRRLRVVPGLALATLLGTGDGALGCRRSSGSAPGSAATTATLASGQQHPDQIALDRGNVYWTVGGTHSALVRVPKGGGAPATLSLGVNAFAVAPESDWAYGLADKAIWKSDLAGGRPVPFVIEVNTRGKDLAIAVDEASVYWGSASAILSVPRQGGSLVTLATARTPSAIVLDATTVYWLDKGELTTRDDGSCCERPSAVMKVSRSGGAPTTLASGQFYSGTLALEGSSLFWTTQHISLDSTLKVVGTVLSVPTKGGVPITLASTKYDPTSIAVDSSSIYWTELGGVMKMPRTGGAPVTIAEEQNEAVSVAVDTTSVYWTSGASGMVVKVTSK